VGVKVVVVVFLEAVARAVVAEVPLGVDLVGYQVEEVRVEAGENRGYDFYSER
jgi:hypothetical protein